MDFYSKLIRRVNESNTFATYNNIRITRVEEGRVEGELTITSNSKNPLGHVHGGAMHTLADTVAGTAAMIGGRVCVTLDSTFHYLRPGREGMITCVATVRKTGNTIVLCDVSLTDDSGAEVATGCFTFFRKEQSILDSPGMQDK